MQSSVLIITDDKHDANILSNVLSNKIDGNFKVEWFRELSSGIKRIITDDTDAIVVDLLLPDCYGIDTFNQLIAIAPDTPIVILSDIEGDDLAIEAMKLGAQGYLSQGNFVSQQVPQIIRNIIHRKTFEESQHKEKSRAQIALNSISDAVICTDLKGNVDYLNTAAENMTGWNKEEAKGLPIDQVFKIIKDSTNKSPVLNPIFLVLNTNKSIVLNSVTLSVRHDAYEAIIEYSASSIHDSNGRITGAVIVFHDLKASLRNKFKIADLAKHDYLSNLPISLLFNDRISQAITLAKREKKALAILFLDLDNLKNINNTFGYAVGDQLLQSMTQRLKNCVRGSDSVNKLDGDEFVLLLNGCKSSVDAALAASKILKEIRLPHLIANYELNITASIGISIYPEDGSNAETLIKSAVTAMYNAKEKNRNNYQFFRHDSNIQEKKIKMMDADIRGMRNENEFTLLFQPKLNSNSK